MRIVIPLVVVTVSAAGPLGGCHPCGWSKMPGEPDTRAGATAPALEGAVGRGVHALVGLQDKDGSFSREQGGHHIGITALAGLALLDRDAQAVGPSAHADATRGAWTFVLANQDARGVFATKEEAAGPMYSHAFATLFLAQVYATTQDAATKQRLADPLARAVKLMESAQNKDGGWRYTAEPADADVSVTAAVLKALLAAKKAGVPVSQTAVDNALRYVRSLQNPDGGFQYVANSGGSGWARSAAATAVLLYTGAPQDKTTHAAMEYLEKNSGANTPSRDGHFFYGNYYLAQVLHLNPQSDRYTYTDLVAALLARQDKETGRWDGEAGPAYATATALIALQMPTTRLPAFTK